MDFPETNSDPMIMVGAGGCPAEQKLELETEYGHMADMQCFLQLSENETGSKHWKPAQRGWS